MTTATRSALHTPLCERLGIRYPICQAGMAFVARAQLAAAVSAAGGLGVIAAAHGSGKDLREEIHRVRDLTDKPFGVDILFASVRASGQETERFTDAVKGWIDVALEERVPVLIAGLGNPGPVTAEAHRLGITVMALCGNVKQARDHAANDVDVIIAQGHEGGGHTRRVGGVVLTPAAIDEEGTVITRAVSGKPNRQIRNAFTREWESRQAEIQPFPVQYERVGKPAAIRAREEGDVEHGSPAAGQSAGLVHDVRPVADVMASIVDQAEAILQRLGSRA